MCLSKCVFMAALGLHCCLQASSRCRVQVLIVVASIVAERGLQGAGLSSCGAGA